MFTFCCPLQQHSGIEIWRIENFRPVLVPKSSHGKFFTGDSYVILKTTALKSGALRHDIHYWLGKDTSQTRLYVCKGKHVVHVKEVSFARSSLNHDDIFIQETKSKIFQFNGSNSSIQERAKALEVVQYIKDTYHDGKCEVAAIGWKSDGDVETGEFWGFFGGFAPLPRKTASDEDKSIDAIPTKLFKKW
ncbi:Villin-4 [Camellia lanceoleosa]|uniref:Villin-4 n=1 Tax=Camellia lanceoleosa TaxID=1840588 RepID=A0ACC0GEI4_9ERIC|nr:Villin-4 [Camellia lanceoleosa]